MASDFKSNEYYDFLQPFMINLDNNETPNNLNIKESLLKFQSLAKTAPTSKEFHYLNYKLMQNFQYQYFKNRIQEKSTHDSNKNHFIQILKSINKPSFFTLYSQLYLETLNMKRLEEKSLKEIYALGNLNQRPYIHLLSYIDNLNQLNSISLTDQEILHKKLTLLLIGLPKNQQEYILRLTALQLSPFYAKNSIEFDFNRLFAQRSNITREEILQAINFKDAETFHKYIIKKRRSFFEERVFNAITNALRRNDIAMILATLYMQDNNFCEARSYLRQTPRNNLYNKYNPFSTSILINNKTQYKNASNRRKFAETMSRLEERIEVKLKKHKIPKARDYFLYGNGLYNKSWFGNFPLSSVFFHKDDIYIDNIPPTANLVQALTAYEKALLIADKENFRAEIAYQILKIKFNMARLDTKNYPKWLKKIPKLEEEEKLRIILKASRSFMEALKDYQADYSDTKYGERVIAKSLLFNYL